MRVAQLTQKADFETRAAVRWAVGHGIPRIALRAKANREDPQAVLIRASAEHDDETLFALYDQLRAEGPVVKGKFSYLTPDMAVAREVLSSGDVRVGNPVSNQKQLQKVSDWSDTDLLHPLRPPSLLAVEPPDHTRYRKLVTRAFTAKAVQNLRADVEERAQRLLDELPTDGTVDLAETYCAHLPVAVISAILGVPDDQRDTLLRVGGEAAASLDFGLPWGAFRRVEQGLLEFDEWLTGHLQYLREHPGDNLLSKLVQVHDEEGTLDEWELKMTAGLVLAAGFETTVNLLGNAIALLSDHPDQLAKVKADPDLWLNVVEETLRFDPPVLLTGRVAEKHTEFGGQRISAGSVIVTMLGAANRDPKVFDRPNEFDVTRTNAKEHLAFSDGRHFCLGAILAKMESEVGLRALFERFPDLTVLPHGRERRPTRVLRGYSHLPTRLTT